MSGSAPALLARLEHDTDAALQAMAADAAAEREALMREAEQAIHDARAAAIAECDAREAAEHRAREAATRQQVAGALLHARADAVSRVLTAAAELAPELATHADVATMVTDAVTNALAYLPDGGVEIVCPPALTEVTQHVVAGLPGREEPIVVCSDPTASFGLVIRTIGGRVSVDASVARRLVADRTRLAMLVVSQLDGTTVGAAT